MITNIFASVAVRNFQKKSIKFSQPKKKNDCVSKAIKQCCNSSLINNMIIVYREFMQPKRVKIADEKLPPVIEAVHKGE